jgi:perosamine synthetase
MRNSGLNMITARPSSIKKPNLPQEILALLKSLLPQSHEDIPLHEPHFSGNERRYIEDCIDSTFVSSVGRYVDKFETMLSEYTGIKQAVAVVNGTAALHVALKLVGVKEGDEVLVPALTFVATANAVVYCGAMPHFVDSEERTLGLDPDRLSDYLADISELRSGVCYNKMTGRRIIGLVPVHVYGHPVDLDPLHETCQSFGLQMVEDATESLGSMYKGRHTGHWGKLSVLSFNGNKIITTGGGGAILTNDENLGKLARHITTTAKLPHKWAFSHDMVGYNYRMPNVNAALGCAQLEQLPGFIEKKRSLAERYKKAFSNVDGVSFFSEPEFARSNYWLNVILLDDHISSSVNDTFSVAYELKDLFQLRDSILDVTNSNGIMTRPAWTLMHKLPAFKDCPRMDLSVAERLEARLINVPSSVTL